MEDYFYVVLKRLRSWPVSGHQAGIRTSGLRYNTAHFTDPVVLFRFDTRCIRRETGSLLPGILWWRISRLDTGAVTLREWHSLSHNIVLLLSKSLFLYHPVRHENWRKCSYTHCMMEDTILLQCFWEFAKLRKPPINFIMSVFASVRPRGTTGLPMDVFSLTFTFQYFSKNRSRKFKLH